MMQFHADSPLVFRCEPYAIYWGIQGWSAYNMKQRKALLAKDVTLSEALARCESDAKSSRAG